MKKVLFIIGFVSILFASCAESKWAPRVKDGGMIGMGGDHAPGMRY